MKIKTENTKTNKEENSVRTVYTKKGRGLTKGEKSLAELVFGKLINYDKVIIYKEKLIQLQENGVAMTPFGGIYFGDTYEVDFSLSSLESKKHFIHEMAHVWQHQDGKFVAAKGALLCIGTGIAESIPPGRIGDIIKEVVDPYIYLLEPGKKLSDYNLESQAEIIADYYCVIIEKTPRYKRLNKKNLSRSFLYEEIMSEFLEKAE